MATSPCVGGAPPSVGRRHVTHITWMRDVPVWAPLGAVAVVADGDERASDGNVTNMANLETKGVRRSCTWRDE